MSFWARFEPGYTRHGKWSVLSDDAFRFGHKVVDWCCDNEKPFIPKQSLFDIAGTAARGRRLARELEDCGKHFDPPKAGILDAVDGGWLVHNFAKYAPPSYRERADAPPPAPPKQVRPEVSAARAAAGRKGVEARLAKQANGEAKPQAREAKRASKPEQTGKQTEANGEAKLRPPSALPPSQNGYGDEREQTESAETSQVFARVAGERPIVRHGLLDSKIHPRLWEIPQDFFAYGVELGLSKNEARSAVVDFREKFATEGTPTWLGEKLCSFIETAAETKRRRPAKAEPPADHGDGADELADIERRRAGGAVQ